MLKVSVIVPVYNVEKYLVECLESLVTQTLSDIEIILVDDGSTDSSGDLCDKYAEKYQNIRVIHKKNGGLGDARNVGFNVATGKYVYFIDSDDLLDSCALAILFEEAEKNALDLIMFSAESFSDEDDIDFDEHGYKRTVFLNEVQSGKDLFEKLYMKKEYYASIPMRFYNRAFLSEKGYCFPNIIHEDELYGFLSLVEASRAECVQHEFYKRRFRKGSIMTSEKAYNSAMGYVYTWKGLMTYLKNNNLESKKVYRAFANSFIKLIIKVYCHEFDNAEKKKFKMPLAEMRKLAYDDLNGMDKSIQVFFMNPYLYELYLKIMK